MNFSILEENIKNNDIDKAISIITDIGEKKYKEAVPILIKYLEKTDNNKLRNKIAIALSDIGCSEAVEPIINMIKSPKTIGNRGTLLYALELLDYSSHIEFLINLLYDDNFEVSRHSLILIERIIKDIPNEIKEKYIMKISTKIDNLEEKIDFFTEALDVFESK
jgi:HEAT repeat protein